MRNLFSLLFGKRQPPPADSFDPVLGKLRYDDDSSNWKSSSWEASVVIGDQTICFNIRGAGAPDATALAHAREIIAQFDTFSGMVREYQKDWAKNLPPDNASEVNQLQIDCISLGPPSKPCDGIIFFSGPNEYRCWRGSYANGRLTWLGFDS